MARAEQLLETKEVLRRTGITPSQFHSWLQSGLIPYWEAFEAFGGNGVRYYYPPEIVDRINAILALKGKGKSLREVRLLLRAEGVEV